jgi:hypothetical protein
MDRAQISILAAIIRPLASGLEAPVLLEAKKKLIATVPKLEKYVKDWKQTSFLISNRNKKGLWH